MEFIRRMRKREFVEMTLKTVIAVFTAFVAIILMEGMIYGIELNALYKNGRASSVQSDKTIAYCIEIEEDNYFVLYYNEGNGVEWSARSGDDNLLSKEECENLNVVNVVFHAPNAFIFSITPVHYVVMSVFVLIVCGYFVYRFIALNKEYNKIIDKFEKEGIIEL